MEIEIETTIRGGLPVRAKAEIDPPAPEIGENYCSVGYIHLSFLDGRECWAHYDRRSGDLARIAAELLAEYRRDPNE